MLRDLLCRKDSPESHKATQDPEEQDHTNAVDGLDDAGRVRVYPSADYAVDDKERRRPCAQFPVYKTTDASGS